MLVNAEILKGNEDGLVQPFGDNLLLPVGTWDNLCDYRFSNWLLVAGTVVSTAILEPPYTLPLGDCVVSVM